METLKQPAEYVEIDTSRILPFDMQKLKTWPSVHNGNCYVVPESYTARNHGSVALCHSPDIARRFVALWNAGHGISTEDLERHYNAGGGLDEAMQEASLRGQLAVQRQRDELLASLKDMLAMYGPRGGEIVWGGPCEDAAALVAKVEAELA
jgi:hypothetical protein